MTFEHDGETVEAEARRVVGADGRTSQVREAAGVALGIHSMAVMAGPEAAPEQFFTEAHRDRVLGPAA